MTESISSAHLLKSCLVRVVALPENFSCKLKGKLIKCQCKLHRTLLAFSSVNLKNKGRQEKRKSQHPTELLDSKHLDKTF